jgi:hypothetical protein
MRGEKFWKGCFTCAVLHCVYAVYELDLASENSPEWQIMVRCLFRGQNKLKDLKNAQQNRTCKLTLRLVPAPSSCSAATSRSRRPSSGPGLCRSQTRFEWARLKFWKIKKILWVLKLIFVFYLFNWIKTSSNISFKNILKLCIS